MVDENDTITDIAEDNEEFVPEDGEGNTETGDDAVKKLREKLKKAVEEKQQYLDGWQRDKAEFINIRRRDDESKKEFVKFAAENVITDIIPTLDSFELAMANKESWEKADPNWRKGVEYIYSQLLSALEQHNLKTVSPLGEVFDPNRDSAVEVIAVDDKSKDGKVIEVLQRGYELNSKLIRSPKVKVGEFNK